MLELRNCQLSIVTNKQYFFLKKYDLSQMARVVLYSTNRGPLYGAIFSEDFDSNILKVKRPGPKCI